jgi:non-specific serine/threonine protein kinase
MTSVAFAIVGLAECAGILGDPERAARLYGAADAVFGSVGMAFHPLFASASFHDHHLNLIRRQLGDEGFDAARAEGRVMTVEEAVRYAQGRDDLGDGAAAERARRTGSANPV